MKIRFLIHKGNKITVDASDCPDYDTAKTIARHIQQEDNADKVVVISNETQWLWTYKGVANAVSNG